MVAGTLPPTARPRSRGVLPLALAITAVLAGAAGVIIWLVSSGPLPPPPITVRIPAQMAAAATEGAVTPAELDPGLLQTTQYGQLPIVDSDDGRMAWQVYARPFPASDKRPRIGIVIDDLGTSVSETNAAIKTLPAAISLSFMPYRRDLPALTAAAHDAGHEILLDMPMEPPDPMHQDPGPNALRTALDGPSNVSRLDWMMGRATGYVGMAGFLGGRFSGERLDMTPVLQELKKRGLLYIDNHATPQSVAPAIAAEIGLPFAAASVQLDADPTGSAIDQRLTELEQTALRDGKAIGIAAASALLSQKLGPWSDGLASRNIALAPVSAIAVAAPLPKTGPPKAAAEPKN